MTTVTSVSPIISKDCDPIYVDVTTDSIGSIIPFYVDIYMNNPYQTTGLSHAFVFNGEQVVITSFSGVPCSSVGFVTVNNPATFQVWLDGVAEVLMSNYYVLCNFDVQTTVFSNGRGRLRFLAKDCFEIETFELIESVPDTQGILGWSDVTNTGTLNDYFIDEKTQAFLSILKVNFDGTLDKSMELCADWDIKEKSACFQINKAFNLRPHLPLDPFTLDYMTTGIVGAFDCYCNYKIVTADKYTSSNSIQCIQTTEDVYTVMCGSLGCYNDADDHFSANVTLLHHLQGYEQPDIDLVKCVNINQPDWLYFFVKDSENLQTVTTFTHEDGSTSTVSEDYLSANVNDNGIHYIPSGPGNINLPPGTVEYCVQIQSLFLPGGPPSTVYGYRCYKIDCECHPYDCFLMYFNGCGGCETLYLRGRKEIDFDVERETFTKSRAKDSDKRYGTTQILCASGKETYKVSTGLHDLNQIGLLRQLVLGDLWLVNTTDKTFVPVTTKENSVKIDDKDFYSGVNQQACLKFSLILDPEHCHYNPTVL